MNEKRTFDVMSETEHIESLILKLQNGNEQALSTIYEKYGDSLYGLILKIVKDEGLAQDLLQDCFITIWKKAPNYDPSKGTLFTWMLNICRNRSIDSLRKSRRESDHLEQMTATEELASKSKEMNINTIGLNDVIENLPDDQKLIIEYLYYKGYTQQEVADELGIPLGTVKTRARYALNELRNSFVIILMLWILKNT